MSWHFSKVLLTAYENSRYSQALQAAFSEASSLDGERSARLKSTGTDGIAFSRVKMMAVSNHSRYGTTSGRSMDCHGVDLLTWFLAGFPVKPIAGQLRLDVLQTISGRRCGGLWQMSLPGTFLRRTLQSARLMRLPTISNRWVLLPAAFPLPRATWVQTTYGSDIGYVHTPTTMANYSAPSMQKHAVCRAFVLAFGRPSPEVQEWLMGWPNGWSATRPVAMDKFRSWLQQHGACCELR